MKNFFQRIARFFWSRGFLKFVLWTITLVILFYAEEDWRGARAWAATKAKWEAQGETFDIMRLAPKPVPDDENLAAFPLFKMEPDPNPDPDRYGYLTPLTLNKAFAWNWADSDLPRGGNWEKGQLADAEKNRAIVARAYAEAFKDSHSTSEPFAQFSELVPALADLRATSVTRPYCRFEQNYRFDLPRQSYFSLVTAQIKLSKFLSNDAVLALEAKKPDVALDDIVVHSKLLAGTIHQPILVSGLVAIGMQAINLSAIYQGLATHAWNDQQLAQLQTHLAPIDFLAGYQNCLRGEACIMVTEYDRLKPEREKLASDFSSIFSTTSKSWHLPDPTPLIWPDGWINLLKSRAANFDLAASRLVDVQNRILSPKSIDQFIADIEKKRSDNASSVFSYWKNLFGVYVGPINSAAQKFAIAQIRLDETRIACALERYHLSQGAYPAKLDELAPAYIDSVPHDIIDGKPFHYQARADGTFQLYSVGWNQADDGGAFAFKKDNPKIIDYESGDWPWPTPK